MAHDPIRVVIDLRPLQQPEKAPVTSLYLRNLLAAFAADPVEDERFVALLVAGLPDPTVELSSLPVVARRRLPPTGGLKAAALTVDPFLLRGAEAGTNWRSGARRVYHVAGTDLPLGSHAPVIATLLDLAPWELSATFQASSAARFGHRLRAGILRSAAAVIVGTESVRRSASRALRLNPSRVRVVPFAASAIAAGGEPPGAPPRYEVFFARHDARSDARTLFEALALLQARPRPPELAEGVAWPPVLIMAGASPTDRAELARAADRRGVSDVVRYVPYGEPGEVSAWIAGARAAVVPALSDAAGWPAIDALSLGVPVVASAVGALPEVVGGAGILVEPGDPERLARAISATWADDELDARISAAAETSVYRARTWRDVAAATRAIYVEVAR